MSYQHLVYKAGDMQLQLICREGYVTNIQYVVQ
jgi:hypothetical protein